MKKITNIIAALLITVLPLISLGQNVPAPPDQHGSDTNQSAESAPIGGGVAILLSLGAAYGGKKYYDYRKKLKNEMED
ncbi:MAG: hypothetical protein K9I68_00470 [Bacteroidales bacterium]|nr:hypothetical protein [Bacteroidales bacterium]MCF8336862.1 hypothetical protein [Bacteroidales bacterium]